MAKLFILMVVAFVDMVGLVMLLPLLPFYATHFGADAFVVGVLISAFSVAQLVSAPLWGRLSDQRGRRPAILTGLWISAAAYVVFAFAGSLWMLLLSRVIQGLGGGTIGVVQAYVADASAPEDRAKSLGWLSAVTSLGAVTGPALGSFLARLWGQMAPGLASAALCVLVSVFAWRFLRESRELRRSSASLTVQKPPRSGREAIWHVIAHSGEPAPRLIWIYTVAIGAFYGTVPIVPLLMSERLGVTEANIGYFVMYLGGMGVIVRAGILGRMVDWLGEARLCRLGLVLLAAGLVTTSVVHSYPVLWLSLTLMPIGTAFIFPCVTGLLSQVVSSNERGLFMGVQQTFGGISRVAFPVSAGVLMDRFGRGSPYWISGLMVLAALALTTSMEEYLR
ncbi:MAG: MFS transporter, partial [Gemmatimonadales bacterium]|nr:MFS transporter [Gemmatimonadales bacterium]